MFANVGQSALITAPVQAVEALGNRAPPSAPLFTKSGLSFPLAAPHAALLGQMPTLAKAFAAKAAAIAAALNGGGSGGGGRGGIVASPPAPLQPIKAPSSFSSMPSLGANTPPEGQGHNGTGSNSGVKMQGPNGMNMGLNRHSSMGSAWGEPPHGVQRPASDGSPSAAHGNGGYGVAHANGNYSGSGMGQNGGFGMGKAGPPRPLHLSPLLLPSVTAMHLQPSTGAICDQLGDIYTEP